MTRKAMLGSAVALALAGALGLGAMSQSVAAPVAGGAAPLGKIDTAVTQVRWWGPGPYYYGPPAYYYGPRYYARPPVYVAPPPVVYQRPPVVFEPPPDSGGPVRQCWVDTDRDRGYGYWRPC